MIGNVPKEAFGCYVRKPKLPLLNRPMFGATLGSSEADTPNQLAKVAEY